MYWPGKPNLRFFITLCKVSHSDLEFFKMSFDRKYHILYKKKKLICGMASIKLNCTTVSYMLRK